MNRGTDESLVRPKPFSREGLGRRSAPFGVAMLAAFLAVPLPSPYHRPAPLAIAAALNILIVVVVLALPWERLPSRTQALPVFAYILVIALLRESEGGTASGYGVLVILPILWLALYGTRKELIWAVVGVGLLFLIPVLAAGPPRYPVADVRRGLLFGFTAGMTGFAIQQLVRAVGERAGEARERARELARSERTTKAILDSAQEGFISFDVAGSITRWNPRAEQILGYSAADAVGRDFCETVVSPLEREAFRHHLRRFQTMATSEPMAKPIQLEALRCDGRRFPAELTFSATMEEESRSFHVFLQDITERHSAQQYSLARQAVSQALAESPTLDQAISRVLEALGTALDWQVAEFWAPHERDGVTRCDSSWRAPGVLASELEREAQATALVPGEGFPGRAWRSGGPEWVEDLAIDTGAHRARAAVSDGLQGAVAIPVSGERGILGVLELFSKQPRRMEAQLLDLLSEFGMQVGSFLERKRTEEEADRLKDHFFALVSHELRTPLTSIIGYLELLEEEAEVLSAPSQRFLRVIDRNAKRLLRLVEDLLFVARLGSGALEIEHTPVDLERLTSDAVEAARPKALERDIALSLRVDSVPQIHGDADRLGQLLDNLIGNALKFTPRGGRVEVRLRREDDRAILEVEDTGPGISPADEKRLFEPFYRASSADEQAVPGTGLGLSIVKAVADSHGGRIGVESDPGHGTAFRVEFP